MPYSLAYVYVNCLTLFLTVGSHFIEALAAINRSAFTGFKGYFGILPTLGTNRREHLAGSVTAARTVPISLPCLAARHTPLGFIGVTFGLKELLLFSTEGEISSTIGTLKCFVLETQRMTSFL